MGELARLEGAPKISETPLELLTARPGEGYSIFDKYVHLAGGLAIGFGTVYSYNRFHLRPVWAGIHNYIWVTGACVYAAYLYRQFRLEALAEKDAVLKHYITLHPEDFPPFERKRFKDVFMEWHPAR